MHHQNHLSHFRSVHPTLISLFAFAYIDVDSPDNLSIPIKSKPQSLHWAHEQVSVHSGILKIKGGKIYHQYFSDSKVHDQVFVNEVLRDVQNNSIMLKL